MPSSNVGKALLFVFSDPEPEREEEINRWNHEEHMADELRRVPGVVGARRYVSCTDVHEQVYGATALRSPQYFPKYVSIYELETEEVLLGPEYREFMTNPTEWTRRVAGSSGLTALVYRQVYPEEGFLTR